MNLTPPLDLEVDVSSVNCLDLVMGIERGSVQVRVCPNPPVGPSPHSFPRTDCCVTLGLCWAAQEFSECCSWGFFLRRVMGGGSAFRLWLRDPICERHRTIMENRIVTDAFLFQPVVGVIMSSSLAVSTL